MRTLATFLAAALAAASASAETLHVLNWDQYIDPAVLKDFTSETGIEVEYDEYTSAEVTEAFLISGAVEYDLAVVSSEYFGRLFWAGSIRPIDIARLRGHEHLDRRVTSRFDRLDGALTHAVPYLWGTTGIGYDAEAIAARMPDAPVDSWAMIFDPKIVSRFADCGVSILDAPEEMISIALNYLGHDPATSDPEHLAAAEDLLAGVAPYIGTFDSEQTSRLADGQACIAVSWSGDVLLAIDEQIEGLDIRYSVPAEGAPIWFDVLVMPQNGTGSDASYKFLDFLLRPEVIARITDHVWYPNPNAAAQALVDPEMLANPAVYPPKDMMEKLFPIPSRAGEEKRALARIWRRVKLVL